MKAIVVGDYKSLIHEEALYLKLKERERTSESRACFPARPGRCSGGRGRVTSS